MLCPDGHQCFVEITGSDHGRRCIQSGCQAAAFEQVRYRPPEPVKVTVEPRKRVRVKLDLSD